MSPSLPPANPTSSGNTAAATEPRTPSGWPVVSPLTTLTSLKMKLGLAMAASVSVASAATWFLLVQGIGVYWTIPAAIALALLVAQLLATGTTAPLRRMTAATKHFAAGDYTPRVAVSTRDEVGELATALNIMAADLGTADAQRRDLIANASHELRTPVAAMRAQLENLVDGVTPADRPNLEQTLDQAERLAGLVDQLLDLSRLEAGVAPLHLESLSVAQFLDSVIAETRLATAADERGINFAVETQPSAAAIDADPARLRQVLANLLHNATKFAPSHSTVTCRFRYDTSAEQDWAVFDVVDAGPGIQPADRERVFERLHRNQVGNAGGTGLGLAIARWAVQLHGGTITVVDTTQGCCLQIRIPAKAEHQPD